MTKYTYDVEINNYYSKKRIIFFYTYPNGSPTVAIFFAEWFDYPNNSMLLNEDIAQFNKLLEDAVNQYHLEWPNPRYDLNGVKLDKLTTRNVSYHETFNSPHSGSPWEGDDPFDPNSTTTYNVKTGQWEDISVTDPLSPSTPSEADFEIPEPEPELPPYNPDLDGQTAQAEMEKKINEITDTVQKMKKIAPPTLQEAINMIWDSIEPMILTPRQIAKKIMLTTSGIIPGVGGIPSVPKIDEKTAHLAIYGKFMYGPDGKLIDNEKEHPECVNWTKFKKNISDDTSDINDIFPMKDKVKNMKQEFKNAIKGLGSKLDDLQDGLTKAGIETGIGIAAFTDALTNVPKPQPSLAVSSILGIFSSISKLQAKVMEIIPLLGPLQFLFYLLPQASSIIQIIINVLITPMSAIITGIGLLSAMMTPILALIPTTKAQVDDLVNKSTKATINGHVTDMIFGMPIAGATIKANSMDAVTSDDGGFYQIQGVDAGPTDTSGTGVVLTVSAYGYQVNTLTVTVHHGQTTTQEITLVRGS